MASSLTVRQAAALIAEYLADGRIDLDTAVRAQAAIREHRYYGMPMTTEDRQRLLALRFGIVDTATPVETLLRRAGGDA